MWDPGESRATGTGPGSHDSADALAFGVHIGAWGQRWEEEEISPAPYYEFLRMHQQRLLMEEARRVRQVASSPSKRDRRVRIPGAALGSGSTARERTVAEGFTARCPTPRYRTGIPRRRDEE